MTNDKPNVANRYTVLTFPSYLGSPRHFRFRSVAVLVAIVILVLYASETRVIDNESGEHVHVFG